MDKLGVLRLLNSLFDFYKQKSNSVDKETPAPFDVESLIAPLKNMINNQKVNEQPKRSAPSQPPPPVKAPLQSKMLSVMNSHDQIVERVKNNLNKQKTQR